MELSHESISSLLRTEKIARDLHVLQSTGSTNEDAAKAASSGAPHGYAVLADSQTMGRGRNPHGTGPRTWDSPSGVNLYTSVIFRPPKSAPSRQMLTLAVGIAVAETVAETCGEYPDLKWPNDVLYQGRKLAGVLLQDFGDAVVAGIGLNVNANEQDFGKAAGIAVSIRSITGDSIDRNRTAALLYAHLERWYNAFLFDRQYVIARWLELSNAIGKRVEWTRENGTVTHLRVTGLDEEGFLVGTTDSGEIQRAISGDVALLSS
jgi:BirA family transcriptional regulator, biotin operon repressor / biotin---[acetyl-CoA-carboxylase] ligase